MGTASVPEAYAAGRAVIGTADSYARRLKTERGLDPALYAYMLARFPGVTRQKQIRINGASVPKRIDFRTGGACPAVWEFVVRPRQGGGSELTGKRNESELRKLTRIGASDAKLRILLLVDLAKTPYRLEALRSTYNPVNAGRGRFKRHSVRVVYVHRTGGFDFIWRPLAAPVV